MHTLYLGPSWAVQSYESFNGEDLVKTNLAQELNLTNFTQLANYGNSNMRQLNKAIEFIKSNPKLAPFRILFVVSESLGDASYHYKLSQKEFVYDFLKSDDPVGVIKDLEQHFYKELCKLDLPIALIGAHTNIVDFEFNKNITVLHPSWQNFLMSQCAGEDFFGWPAEIANMWLQGRLDHSTNLDKIQPSKSVVFEIDNIFDKWSTLSNHKLWCGVHPNILGNQLFAKEIADSFNQWIDNVV
jgi:hypothetical protein